VIDAHVRRLEALRRAGIVERMTDGVWRVPTDLPEQAGGTMRSAWAAWRWSCAPTFRSSAKPA
jgi:hypothetical protein